MMNNYYKKRVIVLSFVCAFIIIALAMSIIALIQSFNNEGEEQVSKHLYATVLESGNNYIVVSDLETDESFMFQTKEKFEKGDLLSIEYIDESDKYTTKDIEIVAKREALDELESENNYEESVTTTTIPTSKQSTTTIYSTYKPTMTITKTTNTNTSSTKTIVTKTVTKPNSTTKNNTTVSSAYNPSEEEVIQYVKDEYEAYAIYEKDQTLSEKAKNGFITIVDFIFYDGTIKGKRFNELTASAKAKVIYYTLLIDNKIDTKWPDYKNTIKSKASDLKAKLIAKYMDVTSSICEKNGSACEVARNDLALLKGSLKLTWDVVASAAKYGYGTITTILKNWYEAWRDR